MAKAAGKESVAVRINGREYKIRSDGDAESLREIAGYVDRAMGRVRERTGTVDTLDVAVLTCLNLAREILALRDERLPSGATAVDEDKLRDLIERVEMTLGMAPVTRAEEMSEASEASNAGFVPEQTRPTDEPASVPTPRTLDLPSVEALRDRAAVKEEASGSAAPVEVQLPEARVASGGGRDRAS